MSGATDSGPLVHAGGITRVSEHVRVIPDRSVQGVPNVGIVVGDDATLVVDTGMGPRNGEIVLAAARRAARGTRLLVVTTHTHPEHDLGAQAFPADTVMIRSRSQVDEIVDGGMKVADDFRRRSPAFAALLEGARFRDADVVFDDTMALDLGGVHVSLTAMGPNHTPGDTVALVVEDAVLFSGDIAMDGTPAFASPRSSLARWMSSLDALEAMAPTVIVPSHGPIGDAAMIRGYRRYLDRLRRRVSELRVAGWSVDDAAEALIPELSTMYPDRARIDGAVRAAWREASPTAPSSPTTMKRGPE